MRQGEKACPEGCTEWFSVLVKNPFETPEPLIEKRRDESMIKCLIVCLILLLSNPAIAHTDNSAAPFPAYDENTEKWGYIDQSGQWAIPPVDGYCWEFRDGLARINLYPDVLFVDQEGYELYRYSY